MTTGYERHFTLADELIAHLESSIDPGNSREFSRYTGFVAVSAVTVYELSIKTIISDFAVARHHLLAAFVDRYFERINGRVRIESIKKDYLSKFGDWYVDRFKRHLRSCSRKILLRERRDLSSSYENVVTWRNEFAHEGRLPATATFEEVRDAYSTGKGVIHCVSAALGRDAA